MAGLSFEKPFGEVATLSPLSSPKVVAIFLQIDCQRTYRGRE